MSIGRLLENKLGGKENLKALFDKQCLMRDKYEYTDVKKSIAKLHEYFEENTFREHDEDKAQKLFFDLWNSWYAERHRSTKTFHPSGLKNECERKIFYEFTEDEPSDFIPRKIDGKTQRIFDIGTFFHTYIQSVLYKMGILLQSEVPVRSRSRKLDGRADGIIMWNKKKYVLEIKTMNSFSYAKGKLSATDSHIYQASIYADILNIDMILFVYINKDTCEITIHEVPINKKMVSLATEKMNLVLDSVKIGTAPKRECCASKTDSMANVCPYRTLCFE